MYSFKFNFAALSHPLGFHIEFILMFVSLSAVAAKPTPLQSKAYNFYKKNSMSIEVVKDDELQKVNFRVKNKVSGQGQEQG